MQGILGVVLLITIAWLLSEDRKAVRLKPLLLTLLAQFVVGLFLLKTPYVKEGLQSLNYVVSAIQNATGEGTKFLFGFLGGGELPFVTHDGSSSLTIFAFLILPQILVFSVIVAILWHWRILPMVIKGFAWVMQRTLGIGGAVGLAAASSIFIGMVEAPLVIRAYLKQLSRSEFFIVLTCGMSTVAGSIMVLYAEIVGPLIPDAIGHIITASIINVLGAILIARIMVPGDKVTVVGEVSESLSYESTVDAVTRGTADGVKLVVNVGALLIVLISLVALVNYIIGNIQVGGEPITLARIFGWGFAPIAWFMGVPWVDAQAAGGLLGTKLIINELIAFTDLSAIGDSLQPKTQLIMMYAICGFTNLGSIGILIGGLSTLAPERRDELLVLGPRTLASGTIVACLTGTIVGLISYLP